MHRLSALRLSGWLVGGAAALGHRGHCEPHNDHDQGHIDQNDLQLTNVMCLFRHGARTPVSNKFPGRYRDIDYAWKTEDYRIDYDGPIKHIAVRQITDKGEEVPPSPYNTKQKATPLTGGCCIGELTSLGFQNAVDLGSQLREKYIKTGFLRADSSIADQMFVRSTNYDRTLLTLRGVLVGLIGKYDGVFTVQTLPHTEESLFPNVSLCQRFRKLFRSGMTQFSESPDVLEAKTAISQRLECQISDVDFVELHDLMSALQAHGRPLPDVFDEELQSLIKMFATRFVLRATSGQDAPVIESVKNPNDSLRLACAPIVTSLTQTLQQSMAGTLPKFVLLSAHDTSVLPVLWTLGRVNAPWPKYCSNITFELYRHNTTQMPFVRVLHDDKPLPLFVAGCTTEYCPLSNLLSHWSTFAFRDHALDCDEPTEASKGVQLHKGGGSF